MEFVDVFCGSGYVGLNAPCRPIHLNDTCIDAIRTLRTVCDASYEKLEAEIDWLIDGYFPPNKFNDYYATEDTQEYIYREVMPLLNDVKDIPSRGGY